MLPSQTLVRFLLLWLIGALAASIWPVGLQPWLMASGVAAAGVLFDLFLLVLLPRPSAERRLPGSAALNVGLDVHLRLHNPGQAPCRSRYSTTSLQRGRWKGCLARSRCPRAAGPK